MRIDKRELTLLLTMYMMSEKKYQFRHTIMHQLMHMCKRMNVVVN